MEEDAGDNMAKDAGVLCRTSEWHVFLERVVAQILVGARRGVALVVRLAGVGLIDAERAVRYPFGALTAAPILPARRDSERGRRVLGHQALHCFWEMAVVLVDCCFCAGAVVVRDWRWPRSP